MIEDHRLHQLQQMYLHKTKHHIKQSLILLGTFEPRFRLAYSPAALLNCVLISPHWIKISIQQDGKILFDFHVDVRSQVRCSFNETFWVCQPPPLT